ncbi:13569_t:CDS:2 [Funneliformis geosporum]|uniref:245_t:CDS:1 n=1 Tax=Funneliformis geosporum TaxID=1117311 RepID=A0A9W4SCF9_9GLOM|nr:13569_t:CDS:2 [Funneliformis geosporum]CAI2163809.1 245_t:CDS:2 [Funneliformis geosporum]
MAPKKNTTTITNESTTENVSFTQTPPTVPRKRRTRSITRKTAQEQLTAVKPTPEVSAPEVPTPVAIERSRNRSITKNDAVHITFVDMELSTTVDTGKGKFKRRKTTKGTEVKQKTPDAINKITGQSISSITEEAREIKFIRNNDDVSETSGTIEPQPDQSIYNIITTERIIDAEQSLPASAINQSTYQPVIKTITPTATTGRSKGRKTARNTDTEYKPPDAIEPPVDHPITSSGKNKGKKAVVRSAISIFTDQPTPIKVATKKIRSIKPAIEQTGKVLKSLRSRKPARNVNQATTFDEQSIAVSSTTQEIYAGDKERDVVADQTITAAVRENPVITNHQAAANTSTFKIYTRGKYIADQTITEIIGAAFLDDIRENTVITNFDQSFASTSRIDSREKNVADQTITADTQKNTVITNTAKVTSTPRLTRKFSQPIRARSARLAVKAEIKEREERERLARVELMQQEQPEQPSEEAHTVKRKGEKGVATVATGSLDEMLVNKRTRHEPERNITPAQDDDIEQANIKYSRGRSKFEREVPTTNQQTGNEFSNARHNMRCVPPLVADPTPRNISPYHWYLAQSSWQNNSKI